MSSDHARPDWHALLELKALLTQIANLRDEGDAERFGADKRHPPARFEASMRSL